MIFRQLFDMDSCTYTYLLGCQETKKAVLIDPVKVQMSSYMRLLQELGLTLEVAMDTHVHADHITALGQLRQETGCRTMLGKQTKAECVSETFQEGDTIQVGQQITIKPLYTPGHTDDSYCFVVDDKVFTGDTLLIRGTGRTDFQNGNAMDQYHSLFDKLLMLPDDTIVYPGHDYRGNTKSYIGEEKAHNPRLQVQTVDAYVELMNHLDLPNPKYMDVAVPSNLGCGVN